MPCNEEDQLDEGLNHHGITTIPAIGAATPEEFVLQRKYPELFFQESPPMSLQKTQRQQRKIFSLQATPKWPHWAPVPPKKLSKKVDIPLLKSPASSNGIPHAQRVTKILGLRHDVRRLLLNQLGCSQNRQGDGRGCYPGSFSRRPRSAQAAQASAQGHAVTAHASALAAQDAQAGGVAALIAAEASAHAARRAQAASLAALATVERAFASAQATDQSVTTHALRAQQAAEVAQCHALAAKQSAEQAAQLAARMQEQIKTGVPKDGYVEFQVHNSHTTSRCSRLLLRTTARLFSSLEPVSWKETKDFIGNSYGSTASPSRYSHTTDKSLRRSILECFDNALARLLFCKEMRVTVPRACSKDRMHAFMSKTSRPRA
ncbi:hypothetical protein SELMODRAFT_407420 [Selaginella moellendorffii]|uniref:Uncharacterized protein n=1 Tax=Selaginella moellendorffii TaxID=88036 RepID=D8R5J4_SELML|nr:hypothetical protein SELMODRAFT_407420 [Selaginella moellendorffii]